MLKFIKKLFAQPTIDDDTAADVRKAIAMHKLAIVRFTSAAMCLVDENDRLKAQNLNTRKPR